LKEQLGVESTTNPAANQIVAFCKDDAQADVVQQYLEMTDVSPVQVNIDCLIIERFGDITMDWETSILVQNLLGEEITLGEQLGTFFESKSGDAVRGIKNGESVLFSAARDFPLVSEEMWNSMQRGALLDLAPAFPGAALRETERGAFGMDFGYWDNMGVPDHQVRTIVDVLVSRGYLKILLNPKLETINGKEASVTIKDYVPIEEVKTGSAGASGVYNITKYVWVSDTLTVTPHVYADGSVGLQTEILIGSRSKPEGVVQRPIITERSIKVAENRIETGKSLIIGGMRKSEKRSVIRGVPFLKDIPLLGILFSSKDFEEKGTEIIFILTPSVSSGGVENEEIVEKIRGKYEEPQYKQGLTDIITDPLGQDPSTQVIEKEATEAEMGRIQAELDLELAQTQAQIEKENADKAEAHAEQLRQQAEQFHQQAQQAQQEALEISAEAQNTRAQIQAAQKQAQELEAAKQKVTAEAQQAQAEAEAAKQKATEAAEKVEQTRKKLQQAQEQLKETQQSVQENKSQP
jgi:type II secretory pathway component GspD/PulD (secretin)